MESSSTTGERGPIAIGRGSRRCAGTGRRRRRRCWTWRRDRRAGLPPRSPRARDRRAPARLAVGDAGRPAAVFARGRHTHRGRAVRRGRRLRTIRPGRAADELSRLGALGVNDGEPSPAGSITKTGSAHARRLLVEAAWHYRKAPATRATSWPTPGGDRDRVDRATPAASHLDP